MRESFFFADLRQRAIKGVFWSASQQWGTQIISLITFVLLARLLEPEVFGLIALASVFTGFIQIFMDQGMSQALVQQINLEREDLDTAFWSNMLISSLFTIISVLLSKWIAILFSEPRLGPILSWLSISFVFYGLSSTQQAVLQRKLDIKGLAIRVLVAKVCGGIVGIGAALLGFGVWSLVAQSLTDGVVSVVVLWAVSDWRPGFRFSKKHFLKLFTFGIKMLGIRVTAFLDTRLDDFLIGYFLGTTMLGYYSVAYRLLLSLNSLLGSLGSAVAFPLFSRLQDDDEQLRETFYKVIQFASLLIFPIYVSVALLAPELISVLFGLKWMLSAPVLQWLVFVGLLHSVLQYNGNLIVAKGEPGWLLGFRLLSTVSNVIAFAIGIQWGIVGVAASYTISNYLIVPFSLALVNRLIKLDFKAYANQFTTAIVGTLIIVVVILGLKDVLNNLSELWGRIAIYVTVIGLSYLTTIHLLKPSLLHQLLELAYVALPGWDKKESSKRIKSIPK